MRALLALLLVAGVAAYVAYGWGGEEGLRVRVDRATEAGDVVAVEELLAAHRFDVIYLVDDDLEAWLKQMELPELERAPDAEGLLARALATAKTADKTFGGDAYSKYAEAWAAWSVEQRMQFRDGQAKFGAGREAQKEKRYDAAAESYRASLALAEPLGDAWGTAQAEQALGDLAVGAGRFDEAKQRHARARDIWRTLSHPRVLRSLHALGVVYEEQGELAEARASLEEMLTLAEQLGGKTDTAAVRSSLSRICRALGDEAAAAGYASEP